MRRRKSSLLIWVAVGVAAYLFKDKIIALYHSVVSPASPVAAAQAAAAKV